MRHPSLLLSLLMLALTGCPRLPGLVAPEVTLTGRVEGPAGYETQALPGEVANGATVSLVDPANGTTVATALTQPDGSFNLNIRGFTFESDRPYLLEALKGLAAGGAANRAGAPGARLRTLVSRTGANWTSLSGPSVRINPSTTALCIVSSFRGLDLAKQQALMAKLPPATGGYAGTADLPSGDFTAVEALVNASLTLDQDPVHAIARNTLNGTYVRMERGPFVTNVSLLRAVPGTTVTLYGTGLDPVVENHLISFNGTAASSMSLVPGGIAVTVPNGATTGPLTLRIGNLETVAATTFSPVLPMTTIQTLAGTMNPQPGTLATAWGVFFDKVANDSAGNVYASDGQTQQIYRIAANGQISLFAGTGGYGFAGDGGPATAAKFNGINGLATDASGHLYIADFSNYRVRRIDAGTGIITTVVGNGTQGNAGEGVAATTAQLNGPLALAFDPSGNLYVADNKRVRRVTPGGVISTYAGNGTDTADGIPATTALLDGPRSLACDAAGNLYFAQSAGTKNIRKVDTSGVITTLLTNTSIQHLAADGPGNLYYPLLETIRRMSTTGAVTTVAGISGQAGFAGDNGPATSAKLHSAIYGLASTATGTLYIADSGNWRLRRVEGGTITTYAGTGARFAGEGVQALTAQFSSPMGGAYDSAGNLYIVDRNNYRIRKVSPAGIVTTVVGNGTVGTGGNGGLAVNAQLNNGLYDLAVDPSDNLFILDKYAGVRKVTAATGIITPYAGGGASLGDGGPATAAQLNQPEGIACDTAGNVYIADYNGGRIRKITAATGLITTVAGIGPSGTSGDGGLATAAGVPSPTDVAVDAAGNLYIAGYNYNVRKVTAATGIITTIAGNGNSGYTGDGGLATSARIDYQSGIAVDGAGNVYVSVGSRIRMIEAATGIIRTVAGGAVSGYTADGAPATGVLFNSINKLTFDANGYLVFGDTTNNMIRRLQ